MPKEEIIFRGTDIGDVVRQLQEAGATARKYQVQLFDGQRLVGNATEADYNVALLSAVNQVAALNLSFDISTYRTEITLIGERTYAGESRAAGAGPSERPSAQYTKLF